MSKGKCEGKVKEKIHEVREGNGESKGERKVRERLPELVFNENPYGIIASNTNAIACSRRLRNTGQPIEHPDWAFP